MEIDRHQLLHLTSPLTLIIPPAQCPCGDVSLTSKHLFLNCKIYDERRTALRDIIEDDFTIPNLTTNKHNTKATLEFLKATRRV